MSIKKRLKSNDWCGYGSHGHSNGYVGVAKGHPWFGLTYDTISERYPDLNIHRGLTYSELGEDGLWWVGFDTLHYNDNKHNCNLEYCTAEVERLYSYAISIVVGDIVNEEDKANSINIIKI